MFLSGNYLSDKLGRMRKLTSGGQSWYFAYTAGDERIWIKRQSDGLERWTLRGLDGQVLREYDAEWLSDYKDYVWRGRNLLARIEPTTLRVPAPRVEQTLHVATDHLGTPRAVTDAAGSVVESRRYYPFGAEITTMASSDRMQFTGHERDDWSTASKADDFDYMHARSYNPQLARFLQVDPFEGWATEPQSLNRYAYVSGNPMNFIDPWGLTKECDVPNCVVKDEPYLFPHVPVPLGPINPITPSRPRRPGERGGHRPAREKEKPKEECAGFAFGISIGVAGPIGIDPDLTPRMGVFGLNLEVLPDGTQTFAFESPEGEEAEGAAFGYFLTVNWGHGTGLWPGRSRFESFNILLLALGGSRPQLGSRSGWEVTEVGYSSGAPGGYLTGDVDYWPVDFVSTGENHGCRGE